MYGMNMKGFNTHWICLHTVDLFSSFSPVSLKTKNETILHFSNYLLLHEMQYMVYQPISTFLTACWM